LVSNLEVGVWKTFIVSDFLVMLHSNSQLGSEIFMDRLEFVHIVLSLVDIGTNNSRFRESEKWVITLVHEEWRHTGRCVRSFVECELSKRKELGPVILVICTIHVDILLKGLINALCLSISLGMVARREMHGHVEKQKQIPCLGRK
jgi:hypothetical protein